MLERKYVVVEEAQRECVEVTNLTTLLPSRLRMVLRFAQKRKEVIEEKYFISVMSPVKHCEITARDELLSCPGSTLSMIDVHSMTHRDDFQIGYRFFSVTFLFPSTFFVNAHFP